MSKFKGFSQMSEVAQEVAESLDEQLYDCQADCKAGRLSVGMHTYVVQTVLETLDEWKPRLTMALRKEVLDWFQYEYGLCL